MRFLSVSLLVSFCVLASSYGIAEDDSDPVAEIGQSSKRYVELFNRHDAKGLANLWVEDATYITQQGEELHGREEIEKAFSDFFEKNPGVRMEILDSTVLSASGDWAVETGTDVVTFEDGESFETTYLAYLKKVGNEWLIQTVGERAPNAPPPASYFLKDLEWLIGEWKDDGGGITIESKYDWSFKKRSIRGTFRVLREGELEMDGWIRIAWDPVENNIRSWTFDSEGGDAEGAWFERGGKWYVRKLHILPNGQTGSSLSVFHPIDENTIEWSSVNREAGGQLLPDVGPIKMIRVTDKN